MEILISQSLVEYEEAIRFMEQRVADIRLHKNPEMLWLLEHPPLYTAGSSATLADLLDAGGLPVYQTGRGGQYTYHGPGQRIAYFMLDLKKRGGDIRVFVKQLEQCVIETLHYFGIKGEIREGRVGVWVKTGTTESKIAAIGIRVKSWVTYHGVAINIDPDLRYYNGIIPCGIKEYGVTSLAKLGVNSTMQAFDEQFMRCFREIFGD